MKSIWQKKKISLGQDITSKAYKKTSMPVGIFVYIVNVYLYTQHQKYGLYINFRRRGREHRRI